MSTASSRDIALVTIDCFRHDAPERMPNLRSAIGDDATRTEAIAPSCSTPWVSPALLQSRVFPDVLYDAKGPDRQAHTRYSVDETVPSLPRLLSEAGYETGAFIAANPYLRQYADHFDTFWDGFDEEKYEGSPGDVRKWTSRLYRTLFLRKQVTGEELLDRAKAWYASTGGPTFLWMHFMEPHFPYYPGLQRGRHVGLLSAYRASLRWFRSSGRVDDLTHEDVRVLRSLYWQCIERVDEYLPDALEFLEDDALVVLTGDHGEAFEHGWINHHGLYDETVRVPLLLSNFPDSAYDGRTVRQLDIPATIVDALDLTPPDRWDGVPFRRNQPLEAVLALAGPKQGRNRVTVGLRTDEEKLIRRYDTEDATFVDAELYDLKADPDESVNRYDRNEPPTLQDRLEARIDETDLLGKLERFEDGHGVDSHSDVSEQVEDRLVELGYA